MPRLFFKKWAFLLVVICFNLIIGLRTSLGFFYFFFCFMLAILGLSLAWLLVEYFTVGLRLERKIVRRVEEGDALVIEARVENTGILPLFNIVIEDYLSCAEEGIRIKRNFLEHLWLKSSQEMKYGCICHKRGRYLLGPYKIYFFDPLGIFFLKKTYILKSELYVYPKTFKIHRFPMLSKGVLPWFGIDTTQSSGDDDEFFGTREYRSGDPVKKIHWISTARKNKLIVKQFQRQLFFRATIIFNLEKSKNYGEGKETVAEYIIKIAASVARYLVGQGVAVEVIAHAVDLVHMPFNKGGEHLEDIFKFLTIAEAESNITLGEIFEQFSHYISDSSTLIVIMIDKDWEYLSAMLPLEKRNIRLIPLILSSATFLSSFDKGELLKDMKMKVSQVSNFTPIVFSKGDNLEEVLLKA